MIFGTLSAPADASVPSATLAPPSPYAVRTPMHEPPSRCSPAATYKLTRWNFKNRLNILCDPAYFARLKSTEPQPGLQWGDYVSLKEPLEQGMTPQMLAFFADIFMSPPLALPVLPSHQVYVCFSCSTLDGC